MKSSIVKLISQYLINENLREVSDTLAKESKISLEPPHIKTLKQYLLERDYTNAISHITPHLTRNEKEAIIPQIRLYQILQMVSSKDIPSNKKKMKVLKFIRNIQKDSYDKTNLLPQCAAFVFGLQNKDAVPSQPTYPTSLNELFGYIDNVLSKSHNKKIQTVQSDQLLTSLTDFSKMNINSCLYHNCSDENISLLKEHNCPSSLVPTTKVLSIELINEEAIHIAMSHSNKKFVVLCKSNMIYIYSMVLNNKELEIVLVNSLYIHLLQITSLMWNVDDTMLITSSQDKSIKIFTEKGEVKNKIDFIEAISYSCLLPNNQLVVSLFHSQIYLYDLSSNSIQQTIPLSIVNEIFWSEYSQVIIFSCSSLKEIIIYSKDLLFEKKRIKVNDTIISISISTADKGKYLLINSSNKTPVLLLYDLRNGELIRKYFGHRQNNLINKCRFGGSKDNFIIAGGNKKTCIWSINSSIPIYELDLNTGNVNDVIWLGVSPYNSFMISVSSDNSITFVSNKTIQKFIYASKINETTSNIEDNNNRNDIHSNNNSPQRNQSVHSNTIRNDFTEFSNIFHQYSYYDLLRRRRIDREENGEGEDNDDDNDEDDDDDEESSNSSSCDSNINSPHY